MKVTTFSLAVAVTLAAGPATASADTGCSAIDRYVAEAPNNFQALKGNRIGDESDDEMYEATVYLPDASMCRIEPGAYAGNWRIKCKYLFASTQARDSAVANIRSAITACAGLTGLQLYSVRTRGYNGKKDIDISVDKAGDFDATVSVEHITDAQIDAGQ